MKLPLRFGFQQIIIDSTENTNGTKLMAIEMYEVATPLENTQTLHINIAASSADEACDLAHGMLMNVSEPRACGDSMKFCWRRDEMTAKKVVAFETKAAA